MSIYYTIDTIGGIAAMADWQFDPAAIEADREIVTGRDGKLYFKGDEPGPTPEELIAQIDAETSAAILAGFQHTVQGQDLHFSYDPMDQQNFADTANASTLVKMGVPGLPDTVTWNGWDIERDQDGKEISRTLVRLILSANEFLELYLNGALTHKAVQMEIGSQKKAALTGDAV